MSRSRFKDDYDLTRQDCPQGGRGGIRTGVSRGVGGGATKREPLENLESDHRGDEEVLKNFQRELASTIDAELADRPTMTEFLARLERQGIAVMPSIQSSGRLNGVSFRWRGKTVKGSDLGRAYTAKGLQQKRGLTYDGDRDREALIRALDRSSLLPSDVRTSGRSGIGQDRERSNRARHLETGLNSDQEAMVMEIGKFRTVAANDIRRYWYADDQSKFARDLRFLCDQKLIERRTVADPNRSLKNTVLVLTPKGRSQARIADRPHGRSEQAQRYYAGFVKPAEVRHDAAIYRMYHAERERIENAGGSIKRVVLDYELKQNMFSTLNQYGNEKATDAGARKHQIAEQIGLAVVEGKVVFPDLRIEYETREGDAARVDLELASDHYKTSEVMQKRAAGLRIYGPDSTPRSPALKDPEIVAGLISI